MTSGGGTHQTRLLDAAETWAGWADEHAALHPDVVELVHAAGFSRRWDHGDRDRFRAYVELALPLAARCPSAAWRAGLATTFARALSFATPEAVDEVTGEERLARLSGSLLPTGTAVRANGGWLLDGEWRYVSGVTDAAWLLLLARSEEESADECLVYLLVPADEAQVRDDWDAFGMRGTGSQTAVVERQPVPAHRAFLRRRWDTGDPPTGGPVPPLVAVAGLTFAPSVVGCACRIVEEAARAAARLPDTPRAQRTLDRVERARGAIEAAELLLYRVAERADDGAVPAGGWSVLRRDTAVAADLARGAVDDVVRGCGTGFFATQGPQQRLLRDLAVAGSHVMLSVDGLAQARGTPQ